VANPSDSKQSERAPPAIGRKGGLAPRIALSAVVGLITLWFADYAYYRVWAARLPKSDREPLAKMSESSGVPIETLAAIGSFLHDERRDFRTLPLHKSPGQIRIGAFGDSYTFGDEVTPGLDFPSLLQKQLREAGYQNVEVVNFGSSWWGFGQTYFFWERFGRQYDLDFVLLGPQCFEPDRDEAFNHTYDHFPTYLHGRYILDGDVPTWMDALGGVDDRRRTELYYRFVPRFRYVRYDRSPPAFMRGLWPIKSEDSDFANPFYYSKLTRKQEGLAIQRPLLRQMASGPSQLVFLYQAPRIASWHADLDSLLAYAELPVIRSPYRRTFMHLAGAGNALIARAFFQVLTGEPSISLDEISLESTEPRSPSKPEEGIHDLDEFADAHLEVDRATVASLIEQPPEDAPWIHRGDREVGLSAEHSQSLFGFIADHESVFEHELVLLPWRLEPDMKVELEETGDGKSSRTTLGQVTFPNPEVRIGVMRWSVLRNHDDLCLWERVVGVRSGRVLIGGRPIYEIVPNGKEGQLQVIGGKAVKFVPLKANAWGGTAAEESGDLMLALSGPRPLDVAIGRWSRQRVAVDYSQSGLKKWIHHGDSGVVDVRSGAKAQP
jgi:hypothetical protein